MTKIDIFSGFLGAGKTTLIKKMIAESYKGQKLVLIENEFGEIGIDGGFLQDSGINITEMNSGCICCSLVGDFGRALKQVISDYHPDRILIEPSGVGKLSDVIVAVENTVKDVPDMKLNSFVTVADATKVKIYMKNFGEFYNNQIESAGTIILSRTQRLSQEKLEAAVALSRRYINDRFLPDKAIDLMDEAASRVRMEQEEPSEELKSLEEKLNTLAKDKEAAVAAQDFEKAAQLRDAEKDYQKQLEAEHDKRRKNHQEHRDVTAEDIAAVVSGWTGVPVTRLTEDEGQRLLHMEDILHKRVVGQDEAVKAVARAIRRGRVGLKDPKRPIGSFLFLGPTGVGKTELCKSLAEAMFGDENAMIRIDMSEYMERHTVSRLVGSPPGYVGHDEGGQLTEKVRRKPYSVVLFDEIEKAHEDVWNIMLQILDDGRITDSQGRTVDFKNTVIVMTSNIGAKALTAAGAKLGFDGSDKKAEEDADKAYAQAKETVMAELRQTFRPEFLNRIDDIIVFRALTEQDIEEVARRMLKTVAGRMEAMDIHLDASDEAVKELAKEGFDPRYGARPLRRAIQSKVEDAVAEKMLDGTLKTGDTARLAVEDDKLVVTK